MKDYFLALGGGNEIGASSYLLVVGGTKLLVDVGMRVNADPVFPDFTPAYEILGGLGVLDGLLITHAHLDHVGALTRFQYEAPHVPKYTTLATIGLMEVMLRDALRVSQKRSPEDWGIVEAQRDLLDQALATFHQIRCGVTFSPGASKALVTPISAGHILGACSYLIQVGERRIMFTGDFSLHPQRTVPGASLLDHVQDIDTLIIESTYAFQPTLRRETVLEEQYALATTIAEICMRGGRVLVPTFALGRAQEVGSLLGEFLEQGLIPPFKVYMDGLVKEVNEVYNSHRHLLQGRLATRVPHAIYNEWVRPSPRELHLQEREIERLPPVCIISSSGMLLDNTRSARYAELFLPNERDAVLFSGYLDIESPGYRALSMSNLRQPVTLNGRRVDIRATVKRYYLSAHAQSDDLKHVIQAMRPRNLILIHGDYRYDGDPDFIRFLLQLEREGIQVYQAVNGTPIYL